MLKCFWCFTVTCDLFLIKFRAVPLILLLWFSFINQLQKVKLHHVSDSPSALNQVFQRMRKMWTVRMRNFWYFVICVGFEFYHNEENCLSQQLHSPALRFTVISSVRANADLLYLRVRKPNLSGEEEKEKFKNKKRAVLAVI